MGNQSSIYIHLDQIDADPSKPNHYRMVIRNQLYDKCNYFLKVTYKITYYVQFPRVASSTEFYLLFTKRTWTVVNFTYYPHSIGDVIDEVYCFYSKVRLDEPLVLGFKTRNNRIQYYRYMDLDFKTSTGLPPRGFDEDAVPYNLRMENQKLNKKFTFLIANKSNVYINGIPGEQDPKYTYREMFKRVFRKANTDSDFQGHRDGPWVFYSSELFTLNRSQNNIDSRFLRPLHNLTFYALYVYYTANDNIAVLIEFVRDFNDTIFIARRNREGTFWEKVNVNKSDGTTFDFELERLQQDYEYRPKYGHPSPIPYTNRGTVDLRTCDSDYRQRPGKKPKEVFDDDEKSTSDLDSQPTPDDIIYTPEISPSPSPKSPPPELHLPETRHPSGHHPIISPEHIKEPEPVLTKIDLSNKTTGFYESGNVQLTRKDYDGCDLFCYFLHTSSEKVFNKISFVFGKDKTIKVNNFGYTNLDSVTVYFNRDNLSKPLIMKIQTLNKQEKYYKNLLQSSSDYSVEEVKFVGSTLCDTLIDENDKVNSTITCQIDKTTIKGKQITYGHNDSINLTFEEKGSFGFSFYTHKPSTGKSFKGYVLFNKNKLLGWSSNSKTPLSIQNKNYEAIKVFVLNSDISRLLMVELNEGSSKSYYAQIVDERGEYWTNTTVKPNSDESIKSKLVEINFPLKSSIVVEIELKNPDRKEEFKYPMKMIPNMRTSKGKYDKSRYGESKSVDSKKITVSFANNLKDRSHKINKSYYYVSHQLEDLSYTTINRKEISGVRLFMNSIKKTEPEEIFFYLNDDNARKSKDPLFFYYPPQTVSHKIYVYFHGDDPRPLLVCYDGRGYKRLTNSDNTKWVRDNSIKKCFDDPDILSNLISLYGKMAKQFVFSKDGKETNIKKTPNQNLGNFKRDIYMPDVSNSVGPFILPKSKLLPSDGTTNSDLNMLLDQLNEQTFTSVNVYKTSTGNSLKEILVVEFSNESQKTHISRKDLDGKYWVRHTIADEITQSVLSNVKTQTTDSVIFEIDKTESGYYSSVTVKHESNNPISEFDKYTHSLKDGAEKTITILFKGESLSVKSHDGFQKLSTLENHKYTHLIVYFGKRAKDKFTNFPLIFELNNRKSSVSIFYKHVREEDKHFWEQINIESNYSDLISNLYKTEFGLANSIVVLMNETRNIYGDRQINEAINSLYESEHINLANIDVENIPVKKMTSLSCISKYGFTVYEHDLSRFRNDSYLSLRFFMYSSDYRNKYSNLSFHSDNNVFEEYLYYDVEHQKAYVFFYGLDPRPLMLFYKSSVYKPSSTNYDSNWDKLRGEFDIVCNSRINRLTNELSNLVSSMNTVNLKEIPRGTPLSDKPNIVGPTASTYQLQRYNGQVINVKISYENKSCYRVYHHESNGLKGSGRGFRLGNVTYGSNGLDSGINYNLAKQLTRVSVYYNLFDINHNHPLLVSLRFFDNSYEYYELGDKALKFWTLIDDNVEESKVESKAYEILEKLKIKFERKGDVKTLFKSDDCKEGGNTAAVIGGSVGGVVSTAAVGGGVTVAVRPELILTSLKGLL